MKTHTLIKIVGSLSLGGLVALVGCKGNEEAAPADDGGEAPTSQPADDSSCGSDGSCGGGK